KAKTLLGYAPFVDLEEGLKHTIAWCRTESATSTRPYPAASFFTALRQSATAARPSPRLTTVLSHSSARSSEPPGSAIGWLADCSTGAATTVVGADLPPATREGAVPGRRADVRASRMVRSGFPPPD